MSENNKQPSGSPLTSQSCSACRFWKQEGRDKRLGICVDAVERARLVVPFAINLEASMVFAHGGKDCPCFEQNKIMEHHDLRRPRCHPFSSRNEHF